MEKKKDDLVDEYDCGIFLEWYWQGKSEILVGKPVPMPLYPPEILRRSKPGRSTRDLLWTDWQWDRGFLRIARFPSQCTSYANAPQSFFLPEWQQCNYGNRPKSSAVSAISGKWIEITSTFIVFGVLSIFGKIAIHTFSLLRFQSAKIVERV